MIFSIHFLRLGVLGLAVSYEVFVQSWSVSVSVSGLVD